MVREWA
jgi:hypothetical protein